MNDNANNTAAGFYGLAIAPKLLAALDKLNFKTPTPIQRQAIPVACTGKDVAGIAQTGTGKTIAFGIPLIQALAARPGKALVLVPTRELALQVEGVLKQFAPVMGLRTVALIGGESMGRQLQGIRSGARIIIATPGRLIDHLGQHTVRLDDVRVLVLDEADRMLDMGFAPQIERIVASVPKERQTMLFSATLPEEIMKIASSYMKLPVRVEVARSGTLAAKVVHELFVVRRESKRALLQKLLDQYGGSVLLFSRTKHNARKIARDLRGDGYSAAEIHSDRSLNQRKEALEGFKSGKYRVLVATDIAARGIDVTGIELVINYDLPDDYDNYVHRIGRTGRAGQDGRAISFATPDQGGDVRGIERLIQAKLPVSKHPDFPAEEFVNGPSDRVHQSRQRNAQRDMRRGQRSGGQQPGRGQSGQPVQKPQDAPQPQPARPFTQPQQPAVKTQHQAVGQERRGQQEFPRGERQQPHRPQQPRQGRPENNRGNRFGQEGQNHPRQPGQQPRHDSRQGGQRQPQQRSHQHQNRPPSQQQRQDFQQGRRPDNRGNNPRQGQGQQGARGGRPGNGERRPWNNQGPQDGRRGYGRHNRRDGNHRRIGPSRNSGYGNFRENSSGHVLSNYSGYVPLDLGDRKPRPQQHGGEQDRNGKRGRRR
ncbi:MAG: DEAD/DEAH box helicase [Elusimicrobia bacterium]|nr:DEAD/DEAH box helicase [Elusimicrobiota bacterium]